ncbi:uncharacterized protein [Phyllobates terribilis]|uniref:uncharacterized protein n=1 Tax=Phyllobates terribilis TaxID=111132 RepID=UPI003CCAA441
MKFVIPQTMEIQPIYRIHPSFSPKKSGTELDQTLTIDHGSLPIQSQPQSQWESTNVHQDTQTLSTSYVPCELENLVKVQEIICKDEDFQTRDGKILLSLHKEKECPSSALHLLYLRDPHNRNIVRFDYIMKSEFVVGDYFQIVVLPMHPIGNIKIEYVSGDLVIFIQMTTDTSTFIATYTAFPRTQRGSSIKVLNMNGSNVVAEIKNVQDGYFDQSVILFDECLDYYAKTVIIGTVIYLDLYFCVISKIENDSKNLPAVQIIDSADRGVSSSQPHAMQRDEKVDTSNNRRGRCCKCSPECLACICGAGRVFGFCANLTDFCVNCFELLLMSI